MPEECKQDYEEARLVFTHSPRAAAGLLRLLVQRLVISLGQPGENLNKDIKALVEKGLPVEVQQALDCCRVIGNNAVHPGEIDFDETPESALALFGMINFIVENQITQKNKIAALYGQLPAGALEAIKKRDGGTTP